MRIRLLESISGVHGSFGAGEEIDWQDDKDAKRLIAAGIAEALTPARKKKVETAKDTKAVETATE
jgi:hypothetical protein